VPAEIGRATNLLGTPAMVRDRLRLYREAGIGTLQAKLDGDHATRLDTLAQLVELVREVSAEPGAATR
jgi:alkanesulfonate monooxygenase SsuD/methylene tetrahydromethanopterin reductase-like flavin-dependent oxidoreductase (luciferase family)